MTLSTAMTMMVSIPTTTTIGNPLRSERDHHTAPIDSIEDSIDSSSYRTCSKNNFSLFF